MVLLSSLKPKTFCFILTATATLEIVGLTFNLGNLQGESTEVEAGGDFVTDRHDTVCDLIQSIDPGGWRQERRGDGPLHLFLLSLLGAIVDVR
jgi:hypothetical protein